VRGRAHKGSLTGGAKSLFRLPPKGRPIQPRLVLAEAAIDAVCVAAIEGLSDDTFYAATGGGWAPETVIRLEENFRSTGHILATANAIIAEDKARLGKALFTRKGQGLASGS